MRRRVLVGDVGDSAAVAAEGAPRHHHAGPRQPECLVAPQYHPAANRTEAASEKHRSTATSRWNPSRRSGRRRGQRRRWAELVARRSRSVEGRLLETAGGDRGGQDSPESAGGGVRGNLGSRARRWGGGECDHVDRSVDRADLVWLDQQTDQAEVGRLGQKALACIYLFRPALIEFKCSLFNYFCFGKNLINYIND
jgi:hypothetical protein